jgi:RNA polymerase sigma-70 factor (ECF subfamily)
MELGTLLDRAKQMDGQALAELHDQYYPHVYHYVRYRLQDPCEVEDISSEVFLRLLDALQKNKGPLTNVKGWLLGTAAHILQDLYRRKYRFQEDNLEDQDQFPATNHTEQEVESVLEQKSVSKAIKTLKSEHQHILSLRFSQELTIEETAQLLGKSINAVKALQFRALVALRWKMK